MIASDSRMLKETSDWDILFHHFARNYHSHDAEDGFSFSAREEKGYNDTIGMYAFEWKSLDEHLAGKEQQPLRKEKRKNLLIAEVAAQAQKIEAQVKEISLGSVSRPCRDA